MNVWRCDDNGNWYVENCPLNTDPYNPPPAVGGPASPGSMQQFKSGATRSADHSKIKPNKYTSPLAIARFCRYMLDNEVQADGTRREADNWKNGIPEQSYIDGIARHTLDLMAALEGYPGEVYPDEEPHEVDDILCAIWFNTQGLLHERLKRQRAEKELANEAERA